MMRDIEALTKKLPGLDCGSCGAPTCMAFAEDVVKNETGLDACTVILKRILKDKGLDKEMFSSALEELNSQIEDGKGNGDDGK
jgi:ArsR family metal-binding transcriptional regulator